MRLGIIPRSFAIACAVSIVVVMGMMILLSTGARVLADVGPEVTLPGPEDRTLRMLATSQVKSK